MSEWEKNPAMQPTIKVSHRSWQHPQGAYHYGECPNCGNAGEHLVESDDESYFRCDDCGCEYIYETTWVYRYAGLDPDWSPDDDTATPGSGEATL